MTDNPITFRATFPAIQSAIVISGDGTGLRIKLDIPETDLLPALSMLAMRNTAFQITIEAIDNGQKKITTNSNGTTTPKRTKAKQRVG